MAASSSEEPKDVESAPDAEGGVAHILVHVHTQLLERARDRR